MAKRESGVVEMSSQICLKWNSFLNNIATSFESLWEEEGLVDVTLASDGQCLTAHKVILSASSPFFKKVFQTNPCQHPVIILQDVHFSELEALLIFIYKGEVNIEQKNLPALLKAAETLQIRGLSGGDIFAKESYKRLIELEQTADDNDDDCSVTQDTDEAPKKKQKISKSLNNSLLEKALTPRVSGPASDGESTSSEGCSKDEDLPNLESDPVPNPVYHRLEMKIEPLEVMVEDIQKQDLKEELERLDTGQGDVTQVDGTFTETSRATVTVITEARDICNRNEQSSSHEIEKSCCDNLATLRNASPTSQGSLNHARKDCSESLNFSSDPGMSQSNFSNVTNSENSEISNEYNGQTTTKGGIVYPPFPCPFCDRAYASWGFRRRHIKAVHTISPRLNCKWCLQVLPTHAAWRRHVISAHNLSASDAHNGLLILEEAHMVLQIAHPTRLDTLVNIIKQNSQQSSNVGHDSEPDPD